MSTETIWLIRDGEKGGGGMEVGGGGDYQTSKQVNKHGA